MASVVIDVERLRNVHCGLGQFNLHLARALLDELDGTLDPILLLQPRNRDLISDRTGRFLDARPWRAAPLASLIKPWCGLLPLAQRPALWHATHQDTRYLPLHRSTRLILTIHDLNILREKTPSVIRRRLKRLQRKVNRASVLTTASQHAAEEIRQHLEIGDREIEIIPHGVCVNPADAGQARPEFLGPGPFLFTIGDVTPKKNFHALVELAARLPEYQFVIAGSKSTEYARGIERDAAERGLAGRFWLPGKVSDAQRAWLYQHCQAFLFPSRSEGFGLPVIEAMRCGRPVFCSDATSLPEVGGDLAFYWRDLDPETMAEVVRRGMEQADADRTFSDKLRAHAGQYSWARAARAYLKLYQRVLDPAQTTPLGRGRANSTGLRARPAA